MPKARKKEQPTGWIERFAVYLKSYCANCSLPGFSYIANHNLHLTERLFWLLCVIASVIGVYYLIHEYQIDYATRAVSIVYQGLSPFAKMQFPSISVCELNFKSDLGEDVEAFVQNAGKGVDEDYNFDVESHVAFILFPYKYTFGTMKSNCQPYANCAECAKCPQSGYRQIASRFGFNCSDLFLRCSLSDKEFPCCQYFLPMTTPFGRCFLLNSLHNNVPGSKHWLPTILDRSSRPIMRLHLTRAILVSVLHEEDLPNVPLPAVDVIVTEGLHKTLQFQKEAMVNDQDMRAIPLSARNCYFPDEVKPWSTYKAYSFTTCISDCIRMIQLDLCNCSAYNLSPFSNPLHPDCDYPGYMCLEEHSMIQPNAKRILHYQSPTLDCRCLPSCTEGDLRAIYEESEPSKNPNNRDTNVTLAMPAWPTDQYRRQVLRTKLDIVVSIGGILGLFLGASILSGIELVYYFTLRVANTAVAARHARWPNHA